MNGIGRRTGMTDASGSTTWTYDVRGRMQTESKSISGVTPPFTTSWGYNSADLPTSMTYPGDGETVNYEYTDRMLLNKVHSSLATYVSSTSYDSAGRMDVRTYGTSTAIQTDFDYYPWSQQGGRLQALKSGPAATPSLQNLGYSYDAAGNIQTIQNQDPVNSETQAFGYDALDRLTDWTLNGTTESYNYDPATGNLESKAGVDPNYNDAAHAHAVTHIGTDQKYWYDANGSQTKRIIGPDTFDLAYDAENRLSQVKKNNTVIASFTYDGDGSRVKSVMGSETTVFVGAHYEVTNPGAGQTITKYYFAGTQRVAIRKYTIPTSMAVEYFLGDHLGSTSVTTDSAGTKVSEVRYKPWGEIRSTWTSGVTTTPGYKLTKYLYTGQFSYMDDPTTVGTTEGFGLMFYNARWYDPCIMQFNQPDSMIPDLYNTLDWNRYAYTRYNPIRYVDPSGNIPKEEICKYLGICGKDAEDKFTDRFGNELHDLLWDTDVSWGDKLEWTEDGELQVAMMLLMTTNGEDFTGVLWGIEGSFVGNPMPFSRLGDADSMDGRTSVRYSVLHPEIEDVYDLPLSFGLPEGAYDGNVPYMQPYNYKNWPEGTVGLGVLTIAVPATRLPAWVAEALGIVDLAATAIGLNEKSPYWYNQTFGPIESYPTICMSSMLSRNCNYGSGVFAP